MEAAGASKKIWIVKAKDFVYDVFTEGDGGKMVWQCSSNSPENVLTFLSHMSHPVLSFVDKSFSFERRN